MPCAAYSEPRLAAVYDPLNASETDYRFFEDLVGPAPLRVVDIGSGTGLFASRLAQAGHAVTGVEPAAGMMCIARRRDERVAWIDAGAESFATETRFHFATMTGHVFQVFLDDEHVAAVLANVRRHLAPGGRLAFDSRNPLARDWETWIEAETVEDVEVPGTGSVRVHYDVVDVQGERVTFETHFRFPDGERAVATDTLRFMPRQRLETHLTGAGFGHVDWYGDYDLSAWTPQSPEIIVVAWP